MGDAPGPASRALAVEDEALLAFDLEDMLRDMGFSEVVLCASYEQAEAALEEGGFSHAVFDLNLNGRLSINLIEIARKDGIYVVVASGYESGTVPLPTASIARLTKPYDEHQLRRALGLTDPPPAAVVAGLRRRDGA